MFTPKKWAILIVLLIILTRVVNLDGTARFTQDESSDLLRMEQNWKTKKITLVGPISTDNTKVFGSLTYYMEMPFAAIFGFDPVGPVVGTAFWGIMTAILLLWLVAVTNRKLLPLLAVLLVIWFPLLESSRWAWNPHLIPFWVALGLVLIQKKNKRLWHYLVIGGVFGLTIHHHYIALFSTFSFCLVYGWELYRRGDKKQMLILLAGYVAALLPFVLFDLRHPPGLFFGKYLMGGITPHVDAALTLSLGVNRLLQSLYIAGFTLARRSGFALVTLIMTGVILILDIKSKRKFSWLLLPVLMQILPGIVLTNYETRYFLPGLGFYFYWLIQKRTGKALVCQKLLILVLICSSLTTVYRQLTRSDVQPSMKILREVTKIIQNVNNQYNLKNNNITTTNSPDSDLLALKYRDLLALVNVPLRAASEYDVSENLFVISTADSETVRTDQSVPLQIFKNAKLKGTYLTSQPSWVLYWLGYE